MNTNDDDSDDNNYCYYVSEIVGSTSARRQDGLAGGKKVKYRQFIGGILVKCTLYYSWFNRMKHK